MVKKYQNINETVYRETLDNGLEVIIIPKKGYKRSFVSLATKYGSLVNKFIPRGASEYLEVPLGIAHFLEHKMFEMPSGEDATDVFAKLGLESNASTNYTTTAYLFSGTNNIIEGINYLLDFVQEPYFTDENVAKEQGIIAQELKMYMDDPVDALHVALMENLFQVYPLRYDIGGTLESIKEITKEYLYQCYHTFYHPSNMYLIIVGDPAAIIGQEEGAISELFNIVRSNQQNKTFDEITDITKNILVEDAQVEKSSGFKHMDIVMPKVAVGLKLPFENYQKNQAMMLELQLKILLEATLGPSSDNFQEMLDLELINGNIYLDVYTDSLCGYVKIQANTHKPTEFIQYIREKLLILKKIKMEEEVFERFKKSIFGNFLKSLNNLEFIAFSYLEYLFKDSDVFEAISLFEKLSIKDLKKLEKYFHKDAISDYTILPSFNLDKKDNLEKR